MKATFIAELIEIYRAIHGRSEKLASFLGAESLPFFEEEIERLRQLVLNLSDATAKRNEYHDRLVELGAANVSWGCLERVNEMIYTDRLKPMELARWLLDYAEGKLFEPIDTLVHPSDGEVDEHGIRWPSNAELVKSHGLLPPRDGDH